MSSELLTALIWLGIAIIQGLPATIAAVMAWRTHKLTKQVEIATNSMKDALVKAHGEASFGEGREAGRAEGQQKAAALAESKLAQREEEKKA